MQKKRKEKRMKTGVGGIGKIIRAKKKYDQEKIQENGRKQKEDSEEKNEKKKEKLNRRWGAKKRREGNKFY